MNALERISQPKTAHRAGTPPRLLGDIRQNRAEIGQVRERIAAKIEEVRTDLGADMQRLEDRLDGRLVRIETQMSDLSERIARVEGRLDSTGGPTSKDGD